MCLSIQSKVVKVFDDKMMCIVDSMGVQRYANLMMMVDEVVKVGP